MILRDPRAVVIAKRIGFRYVLFVSSTVPEDVRRQLPLRPKLFHILLALAPGPRHGYAIKKEVEEGSEGVVRMGAGSLYEGIQQLEKRELIREVA